jgi:O-antigen ligase
VSTAKIGASAHNIYLDIAVEMGLFGLLAFLLLLWRLMAKLFSLSQTLADGPYRILAGAFLASFVWICVYGLFDVVILNDKVLMFLVILLALFYKLGQTEPSAPAALQAEKRP